MRVEPAVAFIEKINPSFDVSFFHEIIDKAEVEKRKKLASQLSFFLMSEATPVEDIEAIVPVILKLCVDSDRSVREVLFHAFKEYAGLDADILFSLIADEDDIALPFLRETPALGSWHMVAILRVGDKERQKIIAARKDIPDDAISYVVQNSEAEVCCILLNNPCIDFNAETYQTLYERFGETSPELIEELLNKADLPLHIRILQAKRASHRMRQLLAERSWIAATEIAPLVEDAEENTLITLLTQANEDEAIQALAFLIQKQMLTASLLTRAAAVGEMTLLIRALAQLAGMSINRAEEMIFNRARNNMKTLHAKAGLPQSCLGILMAASDVARTAKQDDIALEPTAFGHLVIEALMTKYEAMPPLERGKSLELMGRYGEEKVRKIAKVLHHDMVKAA